jgi:hypothetical protein
MQWVFTTVIGAFSVIYGAILTYIFKELERLHAKDDNIVQMVLQQTSAGDDRLRAALDTVKERLSTLASRDEILQIRSSLEEDRKAAARDRENIAVMMATKDGVKDQLERFTNKVLDAVDRRLASQVSINRGAGE